MSWKRRLPNKNEKCWELIKKGNKRSPSFYVWDWHRFVVSQYSHVNERLTLQEFTPCKGIRNPESGIRDIFLVEAENLGLGIRNTAEGIRNFTNDWNPESKFHWHRIRNLGPGIWNLESMAWNPESKTVLDSLTWNEKMIHITKIKIII